MTDVQTGKTFSMNDYAGKVVLQEYTLSYCLDWHFTVAPSLVERAPGNLDSAEYLNPPLSPMLIIDHNGNVHQLDYGIKDSKTLQKIVQP